MKSAILRSLLMAVLLCTNAMGSPQDTTVEPWADQLSKYQRFMIAPHLDAGFRNLNKRNYSDAIREFRRAQEIAPSQPVLGLYLAQALRTGGELDQAIDVLKEQLKIHPDHRSLSATLQEYEEHKTEQTISIADSLKKNPAELARFMTQHQPILFNAYTERQWMDLLSYASTPKEDLIAQYRLKFPENDRYQSRVIFDMLIREDNAYEAKEFIDELSATFLDDIPQIDALSYQLLAASHPDTAIKLLLRAYPFRGANHEQKSALLDRIAVAQATAKNKQILKDFLVSHGQYFASQEEEQNWIRLVDSALPNEVAILINHIPKFDQNALLLKKLLVQEIRAGSKVPAGVDPVHLLNELGSLDPDLIDLLSFRELEMGHPDHAWEILMSRYPFIQNDQDTRLKLLDRMALILSAHPGLAKPTVRARLYHPLNTPALRSRQALMLASLKDCAGVRKVLGNFSSSMTSTDWMMLGDCYSKQEAGLAQHAYAKAFALAPSATNARALAYSAYQTMDYPTAMRSWSSVVSSPGVTTEDLRAAIVTALASGKDLQARQWLKQYDAMGGDKNAQYWQLRAKAEAHQDIYQAIASIQKALELEPTAEGYLQLARWQRESGDFSESLASLEKGASIDPDNAPLQADLGFALYREKRYHESKKRMESALSQRPNDIRLIEQLAYTDQKIGENTSAMRYIERAVDHQDRLPTDEWTSETTEKMFSLRRMHEDLGRRWTFSVDAMMGTSPSASVNSPQPGQNYRSYSQAEVDYRLGKPAIDNGKTVSVYGRVFGSGGPQGSIWPIYAPMLGVGLRWKPFSEQVIYLAVEKQLPLDHGSSAPANTMLRLSGSFLNDGKRSDDWKPVGPGWLSQNLYLDAAYYLGNQAYSLTADYRLGYHKKIAEAQTIQPYVRGLANKISSETTPDLRVGVGVQWNLWGHQSRYSAYSSKTYVALEFQYAIKTYQTDRVTGLLNMGFRW